MALYRTSIDVDQPLDEVFAYLSDFSNAQQWDPGTVAAHRLDAGPIGIGSRFRLVAEFVGRRTELTYRIVEYASPRAVTFVGENATAISRDRITLEPHGTGTRVTYDADLRLRGLLRIADPLLALAFRRIGDRARDGLARALASTTAQSQAAAA